MWSWLKSHKFVAVISIGIIIVAIFLFSQKSQAEYDEFVPIKKDLKETLELSGKIDAGVSATLRFSAGGLVTYLGAKEGDAIKKWQTLASIDTRQLQKTLEQKLNLYAIQRGTHDQFIDDNDNSIPDGELGLELKRLLEKNSYQLENTVKDVEYQDLALSLARLSSPIAGVLITSPVTTSNVQVLATDTWIVIDPSSLYFSADIDETDIRRVEVGQKAIITLDAFPDQFVETTVDSISFAPKETTVGTTYEVKFALPSSAIGNLRLGLNGTAEIIMNEMGGVLALPSSAITTVDGKTMVYVKSGNRYEEREIKTGIEYKGYVEVIEGIGDDEHVYSKK